MRGMAALLVVGFHAVAIWTYFGPGFPGTPLARFLDAGWIGVDFFFVLSAFLLSLPILTKPEQVKTSGFWRTYAAKRWLRIAPPYYVSILVVLVLTQQVNYLWTHSGDVALHALYAHNFSPQSTLAINPVYWTLAVEFQFYLILPAFALLFLGRRWPYALAASLGISLAWRAAFYDGSHWLQTVQSNAQLPAMIGHFALGVAAARIYQEGRAPSPRRWLAGLIASLGLIASPFLLVQRWDQPSNLWQETWLINLLMRELIAAGFAGILLLVLLRPSPMSRVLSSAPMRALGTISYSLYLVHFPIQIFLGVWVPALATGGFWLYFFSAVGAAVLGATVFYWVTERPSLWVKNLLGSPASATRKLPPSAPAGIAAARPASAPPVDARMQSSVALEG